MNDNVAYDKLYLEDVKKTHRYLFILMEKDNRYDTLSMINTYMKFSGIRKKIDQGNWSALNKTSKQLYNDIDFSKCHLMNSSVSYDDIILSWLADIYVVLQWRYNVLSSYLVDKIPAEELLRTYNPLHETSLKLACEKLYNKYLK